MDTDVWSMIDAEREDFAQDPHRHEEAAHRERAPVFMRREGASEPEPTEVWLREGGSAS